MKKVLKRISFFLEELLNIVTDILVPLAALIAAILQLLPVPLKWVHVVKQIENWLYYAKGTGDKIKEEVDKIEKDLKK